MLKKCNRHRAHTIGCVPQYQPRCGVGADSPVKVTNIYTLSAARNEPLFSEILLYFWKKRILK